ncbi:ATP-dependent sacrificial sulfur transferase LarE [Caldicellulosiruptor morganii]|uniref:ATP-dependent sacrificial sulfur transferase LarE n=1 Tax=Caldicellulosiruptor morganii TaxID=1387555 RepID=A0ABY7BJN2_9FIRM|nr:ATP-dependent sacrificial sulfur transferase LarE [Caldicellulosiruptor morganii]WAM33023.1 ATP-dependent sacrificial sulfur transferase LarE [Caldicellulosiruptor morganii]
MADKKLAYEKLERLKEILLSYKSVLVAFSGGVDSTFLLKVCHDVLGENCIAVFSSSVLSPKKEKQEAEKLADFIGAKLIVLERDIFENEDFLKNDMFRCYYCKKDLIKRLKQLKESLGLNQIVEGSNIDDLKDFRPGRKALEEEGIKSPLFEVGFTKDEIRFLSKEFGLPTFDKPSMACLVTRIPYGSQLTLQKLEMVEKAEEILAKNGFRQVRVRHHGDIARIEVDFDELPGFFDLDLIKDISNRIKSLGFKFVTLDLCGYRMGSMNQQ